MKKKIYGITIGILLVLWIVSCSLNSDSSSDHNDSYKTNNDTNITDQDLDNLEFYHEMENAWNEKYGLD